MSLFAAYGVGHIACPQQHGCEDAHHQVCLSRVYILAQLPRQVCQQTAETSECSSHDALLGETICGMGTGFVRGSDFKAVTHSFSLRIRGSLTATSHSQVRHDQDQLVSANLRSSGL